MRTQMMEMRKLIENYSLDHFYTELQNDISESRELGKYNTQAQARTVDEVLNLA